MFTHPNPSAHSAMSSAAAYRSAMEVPANSGLRKSKRSPNSITVRSRLSYCPSPRRGDRKRVIDIERLEKWMDAEGLGAPGAPVEVSYISGGSQNEIYEVRRGDIHGALRIPPTT